MRVLLLECGSLGEQQILMSIQQAVAIFTY
jgi:hypothetical protein